MNNNEFYERREDRAVPEPAPPSRQSDEAVAALAVHRDPSLQDTAAAVPPERQRPGIVWVRPSELPTTIGSSWVRRGIDLQSELVRRSRRAPVKAARAGRRVTRPAIARPELAAPTSAPNEEPTL